MQGRTVFVVGSRSGTKFYTFFTFDDTINSFDGVVALDILDDTNRFEPDYCNSRHDGDLPHSYQFERYGDEDGPYRLCHIRAGPKRGYRAVIVFPDGELEAYWVYAYKKAAM